MRGVRQHCGLAARCSAQSTIDEYPVNRPQMWPKIAEKGQMLTYSLGCRMEQWKGMAAKPGRIAVDIGGQFDIIGGSQHPSSRGV